MKILVDWGTSNLRAWLVDARGEMLRTHTSGLGLRAAEPIGFSRVFQDVVTELDADKQTPAIIFGMAGSRTGWQEVPYASTPASAQSIAQQSVAIASRPNTWIIGGVSHDAGSCPEVMRGEEVQALGVMQRHPDAAHLCLPGTHTKWVQASGRTIDAFTTFMTGELYSWLINYSLIATQIAGTGFNQEGFELGCALAKEPLAFTTALFQLRTRFLSGAVSPDQVCSMASGFLIGHELINVSPRVSGRVYLCASPEIAHAYCVALDCFGLDYTTVDPEQAAIAGLLALVPLIEHDPSQ